MSNQSKEAASAGAVGILGTMFLVMFTLKLVGKFDHSWLVVTAPLWGGVALVVGLLALVALIAGVMLVIAEVGDRIARRRR